MKAPFLASVTLAALAIVPLAGCASPSVVHVVDFQYKPTELTVAVGTTVQFIADGPHDHTVTMHDPNGKTVLDETLAAGASVSFKFETAGKYHVFCRFHDTMALAITVK